MATESATPEQLEWIAHALHLPVTVPRLLVEGELNPAGGIIGAGFDEMRWPKPVRAGDELHVESEVLEVRASKSRPEQGVIKVRITTLNQHEETVQAFVGNLIVLRRPAGSGEASAGSRNGGAARG